MSIDLAIKEYVNLTVENAVKEALSKMQVGGEEPQPKEAPKLIRGINGLAQFLGVSIPTAQKLKTTNKIPYRQTGRILIFVADEVLEAMNKHKK